MDNLIRIRFATFEAEKRQPTNTTPKKKKRSKQSITNANDTILKLWDPDTGDSPLEQLPEELSLRSPSPLKEVLEPSLSPSPNEPLSGSLESTEAPDASEPKTYQLTAVGDSISPAKLGLLWIDENGRVEGKIFAHNSGISLL